MVAWSYDATKPGYSNMWRAVTIRPEDDAEVTAAARKIIANEARYRAVEQATGVPWWWIGITHNRESSNDFGGVLHNGDRIIGTGGRTTHVPVGRGPFNSWEEAAIDALRYMELDDVRIWTIEMALFRWELYNGTGYVGRINSPYVWAATNHQQRGKYTSDHGYDPSVWDTQLGCAAMLKRILELRPDIVVPSDGQVAPPVTVLPVPVTPVAPGQIDLGVLLQLLGPLLKAYLSQQGITIPNLEPPKVIEPPKPEPPPQPPAPPPNVDKPIAQVGIWGLVGSVIAQLTGVMGGPLAAEPSTTGNWATILPIAATAIGGLGGFGPLLTIGMNLFRAARGSAKVLPFLFLVLMFSAVDVSAGPLDTFRERLWGKPPVTRAPAPVSRPAARKWEEPERQVREAPKAKPKAKARAKAKPRRRDRRRVAPKAKDREAAGSRWWFNCATIRLHATGKSPGELERARVKHGIVLTYDEERQARACLRNRS